MPNLPIIVQEYIKPEFDMSGDFKSNLILQIQGQAVELNENMPIDKLALLFALSYEYANQLVLRLKNNDLFLIFSHTDNLFLNKENAKLDLLETFEKIKENAKFVNNIAMPNPEFTVNLSKEFKKIKSKSNMVLQTKDFIDKMPQILKPAVNINLQGQIPALAFLFFIYFARSYGHNIFYIDNQKNKIVLFNKY